MKKAYSLMLLTLLMTLKPVMAQQFNYTYNGVTVTYYITSIPKHEVEVYDVPKNVTAVTIPAAVTFNGESFRVTKIGDGSCKGGAIIIFGIMAPDLCNDYYSFRDCKLLKSVVLPNTIKEIGESAFRGCVWLRSIKLPTGLEKIGPAAFSDCSNLNLSSLTLPSGLRQLGDTVISYGIKGNVFNNCNGTLYIPETVNIIGKEALIGCSYQLSGKIGFIWNDTIIINNEDEKRRIGAAAFGEKAITISWFRKKIVSSPDYYLNLSYGKSVASLVKRTLIDGGKYKEVLSYYPNDMEVVQLKTVADANLLVSYGDSLRSMHQYIEAKSKYVEAYRMIPTDESIQQRIKSINADIAEAERLRKIAEEKARREAEEASVRNYVDVSIKTAKVNAKQGQLRLAVESLQRAIDTAVTHQYDYRLSELTQRRDSIIQVQAIIADTSKTFVYEDFRPDLYRETHAALSARIKRFLTEADKTVERNHVSFTLFTDNRNGAFNLEESSRALKKMCRMTMDDVKLQPLILDDIPIKASASYSFDFEYVKGNVKASRSNGSQTIDTRFAMSPELESDMEKSLSMRLRSLPISCDGKYKFKTTSIDVDGWMEHRFELKDYSFNDGPHNAWRSLLIPFWGDKFTGGAINNLFGNTWWMGTLFCYASVGMGTYLAFASSEKKQYDIATDTYKKKNNSSAYLTIATGAAVWLIDVLYVWIKGAENKREHKKELGRIFLSYNTEQDTPGIVYSLNF